MHPELKELKAFHGHLGPYVIVGFRMGILAKKILSPNSHKGLRAEVKTGTKPPLSCIIDGIQFSSGCTLGKGNISVSDERLPGAVFYNKERKLSISLKDSIKNKIEKEMNEKDLPFDIFKMSDEELFLIKQ